MKIKGIEIDDSKLISKDELLEELEYTASDCGLVDIRNRYLEEFGNELIWRYPISDDEHEGVTIVTVKEGFLALPYYNIEKTEYEIFELEHVYLLDKDALRYFIDNWKSFSDDLSGALGDMLNVVSKK